VDECKPLLLGKTYEGEVRLTNNSDSVVDYDWSGQGSGVMVYPPSGQLEPAGGAVVCVVAGAYTRPLFSTLSRF